MKLDYEKIRILRNRVQNALTLTTNKDKIKLPKETLEILLFETLTFKNNVKIKLPIWSGEFLSKLDLSEVSFEDVSWQLLEYYDLYNKEKYNDNEDSIADVYCNRLKRIIYPSSKKYTDDEKNEYRLFDLILINKIKNAIYLENIDFNKDYYVDYSNTNANIDFEKSFEAKNYGTSIISHCKFDGTNLSNSHPRKIKGISSSFANTNLTFDNCLFIDCNLDNIDLSKYNTNPNELFRKKYKKDRFFKCDNVFLRCSIVNSGINIYIPKSHINTDEDTAQKFLNKLLDGNFDGCMINDHLKKSNDKNMDFYAEYKNLFYVTFEKKTTSLCKKKEKV